MGETSKGVGLLARRAAWEAPPGTRIHWTVLRHSRNFDFRRQWGQVRRMDRAGPEGPLGGGTAAVPPPGEGSRGVRLGL
jgi:hypothetical protein